MKIKGKLQLLTTLIFVVLIMNPIVACEGGNDINKEQRDYIYTMYEWSEKWNQYLRSPSSPRYFEDGAELINELKAIEPPPDLIHLELGGILIETYSAWDHLEYVSAHELVFLADQHMKKIEEYIESHDITIAVEPDQNNDSEMLGIYWQAREIIDMTLTKFGGLQYKWNLLFVVYLPEQFD